ncbi:P-loop containing nucleoside triphosphate hydrolase protein [Kickxella alabastrina]|uniref:P-loop containing nucleoside triphosphate hydrolase protein n=1 Tax=Kickxella alabastrina TaxID=61397 RepID=UPI00221E9896|nr:P-loop containing nucleoside triphosphate hydrolase protein [Kickxella alabastrina]KAI7833824.1 P-loop containing nucleoside triphosphate hydrolase protein [Kickxella alabastrina]
MSRTQKNKATEYHLGLLKGKLARLRAELIEVKSSGPKGEGLTGDARVALIGFPSVGKSTLLSTMTDTEAAATPGRWEYNGAVIQLLDLPGIIEGASQGIGRGKQVVSTARTADRPLLEKELEAVPNIYLKIKTGGGISYNATCKQSELNEKFVYNLLHQYRIFNAEILVREDVTIDDFIDAVVANRIYLPCLYVYNKIDAITIEEIDKIAREDHTVVVSVEQDLNMDTLKQKIWEYLSFLRVYTKRHRPDSQQGATIEDACRSIHKSLLDNFKYALVWGKSAKHNPQRVNMLHELSDDDVIEIVHK